MTDSWTPLATDMWVCKQDCDSAAQSYCTDSGCIWCHQCKIASCIHDILALFSHNRGGVETRWRKTVLKLQPKINTKSISTLLKTDLCGGRRAYRREHAEALLRWLIIFVSLPPQWFCSTLTLKVWMQWNELVQNVETRRVYLKDHSVQVSNVIFSLTGRQKASLSLSCSLPCITPQPTAANRVVRKYSKPWCIILFGGNIWISKWMRFRSWCPRSNFHTLYALNADNYRSFAHMAGWRLCEIFASFLHTIASPQHHFNDLASHILVNNAS